LFEAGSCYVVQAGLILLNSSDPLTSISLVAGTTGEHHHAQLITALSLSLFSSEDGTQSIMHSRWALYYGTISPVVAHGLKQESCQLVMYQEQLSWLQEGVFYHQHCLEKLGHAGNEKRLTFIGAFISLDCSNKMSSTGWHRRQVLISHSSGS
jgi:hypothetical protein